MTPSDQTSWFPEFPLGFPVVQLGDAAQSVCGHTWLFVLAVGHNREEWLANPRTVFLFTLQSPMLVVQIKPSLWIRRTDMQKYVSELALQHWSVRIVKFQNNIWREFKWAFTIKEVLGNRGAIHKGIVVPSWILQAPHIGSWLPALTSPHCDFEKYMPFFSGQKQDLVQH